MERVEPLEHVVMTVEAADGETIGALCFCGGSINAPDELSLRRWLHEHDVSRETKRHA